MNKDTAFALLILIRDSATYKQIHDVITPLTDSVDIMYQLKRIIKFLNINLTLENVNFPIISQIFHVFWWKNIDNQDFGEGVTA